MYLFFLASHIVIGVFLGFIIGYTSDLEPKRKDTIINLAIAVFALTVLFTFLKFGLWWAFICFIELLISAVIASFFGIAKLEPKP